MAVIPGLRIRDFVILRQLGQGGMGEVYLAEDVVLGRKVAIKCLNTRFLGDQTSIERFTREAKIQANLVHTNIVGFNAFFHEGDSYYLVQEYVPGITLRELISRTGPLPEQRSLKIFGQLASALDYAHAKGILHRDIKPSNIMVDPENGDFVKVMDFGIARLVDDLHLTQTGNTVGTVYYMSPEQVQGERSINHRSDVFSAGIVLYEMLTGRLPYDTNTDSVFKIQSRIVNETLPDPRDVYPHISEETVRLVTTLCQKDPARRPNSLLEQLAAKTTPVLPPKSIQLVTETSIPAHNTIRKVAFMPYLIGLLVLVGLAAVLLPVFLRQKEKVADMATTQSINETKTQNTTRPQSNPRVDDLVLIRGGTFQMGSYNQADEQPVREISISPFYMTKTELSQSEWTAIMGQHKFGESGGNLPADNVDFQDAIDYCNQRSLREGLQLCYSYVGDQLVCDWNASGYRLPTEAEWEFAARGGNRGIGLLYSGSNDVYKVAWFKNNSKTKQAVGRKLANELNLFDLSGNAWEWCWDFHGPYQADVFSDPHGPSYGSQRVVRGGCYIDDEYKCTVSFRSKLKPLQKGKFIGFRIVRSAD